MGALLWPYIVMGALLGGIGLLLCLRGLFGDLARGRRRCPGCWYDMGGLNSLKCPECGRVARNERALHPARRRWRLIVPGALALLLGGGVGTTPWLARAAWVANAPRPILIAAMYITDGPDTRLRDEFDQRRYGPAAFAASMGWGQTLSSPSGSSVSGPSPMVQSELSWIENWCVRRVAISLIERQTDWISSGRWRASWGVPDDRVRPEEWLIWLGNDGAPAVDDLFRIAHSGLPDHARVYAIQTLRAMGMRQNEFVTHLESLAKTPGSILVRVEAIRTLGFLGGRTAQCSPLMRELTGDSERAVRSAAISQMAEYLNLEPALVDDLLMRLPRESDGPLRHYMISLTLHVDGRCGQARELYEHLFRADVHAPARLGALFGLRTCSRTAEELLGYAVEGMRDSDYCVRLASLQIVEDLGPRGAPALSTVHLLLNDSEAVVAKEAARIESAQRPQR